MSATVEMLAEVSMFALMDDTERASVATLLESRRFAAGEVIFHFGDASEDLYIVRSGEVQAYVETTEGERVVLRDMGPGEVFGDITMFDGGPRSATAVAAVDSELFALGREQVHLLVAKHPHAAIDLLTVMGRRLRATNELLRGQVARNPNVEEEESMTLGQHIADRVATFGGSWTFILLFATFLACWMGMNVYLGQRAFDEYPFILLNLLLSSVAAFQAPVIMMSQNRQTSKDRLKSDLEYRVNVKAELEVAALHNKVDRIYETLQEKLSGLEKLARTAPRS